MEVPAPYLVDATETALTRTLAEITAFRRALLDAPSPARALQLYERAKVCEQAWTEVVGTALQVANRF